MPGLNVTQTDINNTIGDICRGTIYQLRRAINFKRFTDRFTAQDMVDKFGFTLADANLIKSAVGQLAAIDVTLQANRVFIDQVDGLGDV